MTDLQIYFSITMGLLVVFMIWLESCTNKDRNSNRNRGKSDDT